MADHSTYEPEGMAEVREKYSQLQGVMGQFNHKVSDLLSKAEHQFLLAYRNHMTDVHRELQELRSKLAEAEVSLQKDEQISSLERDAAWYKEQRDQLETFVNAMQKDFMFMKDKQEVLEKDREWLARQLKAAKKQQRLLRSDLEGRELMSEQPGNSTSHNLSQTVSQTVSQASPSKFGTHGAATTPADERSRLPAGPPPGSTARKFSLAHSQSEAALSATRRSGLGSLTKGGTSRHAKSQTSLSKTAEGDTTDVEQFPDVAASLRKQLKEQRKCLARDREEAQQLRSLVVEHRTRRSGLEEFFLQAVEDLKKASGRQHRSARLQRTGVAFDRGTEDELAALFDDLFPELPVK